MKGGRKRYQITLNFVCFGQLQQAGGTQRSQRARLRSVGAGTASGGGCWAGGGREREEGDDGEGKGGLGRTRRCGVTVMSARVKWNHC